eukprot:8189867-Pyramimonas_sp.AAC.1
MRGAEGVGGGQKTNCRDVRCSRAGEPSSPFPSAGTELSRAGVCSDAARFLFRFGLLCARAHASNTERTCAGLLIVEKQSILEQESIHTSRVTHI